MKDTKHTSKLISYWLRHHPEDGNLAIDDFGWVTIHDLLKALAIKGQVFTFTEIEELSRSFDKIRWEFSDDDTRIRATHGHSIEVILDEKAVEPPAVLYHGTSLNKVEAITQNGLLTMQRQFVHLSSDKEIAISVGKRHGQAILVEIDAKGLEEDGWIFYKTSDNVWLTKNIPTKYLSIKPWETVSDKEKNDLLAQLNKEITISHPLFHKLKNLKLIMRRHDNDDTLFIDVTNNKVYMVHLTWNALQSDSNYPYNKEYPSFDDWTKTALKVDQMDWYPY
jgi:putative RNA 2'-phosphotransferase